MSASDQPITVYSRLVKGEVYDLGRLRFVGWTRGDGSGSEGYHWDEYFERGRYLGPDEHGIEPIVVALVEEDEDA